MQRNTSVIKGPKYLLSIPKVLKYKQFPFYSLFFVMLSSPFSVLVYLIKTAKRTIINKNQKKIMKQFEFKNFDNI